MARERVRVTQKALAALFGVTTETIRLWGKQGMPSYRDGYTPAECVQWRREQDKADASARERPDFDVEQARKMRADADLAELKRDQMRGDLVPAVDVERRMERLCAYLRVRVLGIRGKWAPKVLGLGTMAEATTTLDALASDVLAALREGADELDDDEPTEEVA